MFACVLGSFQPDHYSSCCALGIEFELLRALKQLHDSDSVQIGMEIVNEIGLRITADDPSTDRKVSA